MNPKYWLYILPIALIGVLAVKYFMGVSSTGRTLEAYSAPKTNFNRKQVPYKPADKKCPIDSAPLTDTAQAASLPSAEDTLWREFKPKLKAGIWKDFFDIKYEHKGVYGYYPKFTAQHQKYHNKIIEISGYMYPLTEDKKQTFFMLSFFPIQQCFFCGGAGPESIVEINSPKGIHLTSKRIRVRGKLILNSKNPERLFYILNEAVELK